MALTSITIENFKCIGDAVTIPIRPITLLFGKNSSGKSTVLQALLYMRERFIPFHQGETFGVAIAPRDLKPMKNIPITLGDFPSLVHRHDMNRKIRICLEFDLKGKKYDSVEIELVVGWDETKQIDSVESYTYTLNGEKSFHALKKSHPLAKDQQLNEIEGRHYSISDDKHDEEGYVFFSNGDSSIIKKTEESPSKTPESYKYRPRLDLRECLNDIIKELNDTRHIGPTREVPPRHYIALQRSDESRWGTGLAAWDAIAQDAELAKKVNSYAKKLKLGYSFLQSTRVYLDLNGEIIAYLKEICSSDKDIKVSNLKEHVLDPLESLSRQYPVLLQDENSSIEVHPLDVGSGISQVFPVLVGALDHSSKIFAVEQPELHIHPAVQVALGDMFIDGIRNSNRPMLIETHSEHLLLRLLRRVRETNIQNEKKYEWRQSEMTPLVREMSEDAIRDAENQNSKAHQLTPEELSVVYVRPTPEGVKFIPISVTHDGDFYAPWPEGFFDERVKELF